jgi:acyl-CoA thioesterase I
VTRITVLAALLAAACATGRPDGAHVRPDGARVLPADRTAAIVYVALGDSTVEGVGATSTDRNYVSRLYERLRSVYPNARVQNLGRGGATSADVLRRQLDRAVAQRPQLVTLSIGPNDITTRVTVRAYESNLDAILGRLRNETAAVIVVNLIPDLAVTPRFSRSDAREAVGRQSIAFNEVVERLGRAHGVDLVDLFTASRLELPLRPDLVWTDGYHPSDLGYARWAELVWAAVETRIAPK